MRRSPPTSRKNTTRETAGPDEEKIQTAVLYPGTCGTGRDDLALPPRRYRLESARSPADHHIIRNSDRHLARHLCRPRLCIPRHARQGGREKGGILQALEDSGVGVCPQQCHAGWARGRRAVQDNGAPPVLRDRESAFRDSQFQRFLRNGARHALVHGLCALFCHRLPGRRRIVGGTCRRGSALLSRLRLFHQTQEHGAHRAGVRESVALAYPARQQIHAKAA